MYQYKITPHFKKQLKHYLKKHKSLLDDLIKDLNKFKKSSSVSLGCSCYKLRIKSSDIPKGKSNSFRVIVYLVEIDNLIIPLSIYFKGDKSTVSKKEIIYHMRVSLAEIKDGL